MSIPYSTLCITFSGIPTHQRTVTFGHYLSVFLNGCCILPASGILRVQFKLDLYFKFIVALSSVINQSLLFHTKLGYVEWIQTASRAEQSSHRNITTVVIAS